MFLYVLLFSPSHDDKQDQDTSLPSSTPPSDTQSPPHLASSRSTDCDNEDDTEFINPQLLRLSYKFASAVTKSVKPSDCLCLDYDLKQGGSGLGEKMASSNWPYGAGWNPRMSMSLSSTKGLLNAPGENNCFLNSAVQVRHHPEHHGIISHLPHLNLCGCMCELYMYHEQVLQVHCAFYGV